MDPASIVGLVAACSSLTKQCASVVKSLNGLIETYKSAELTIVSVITECETIQFAWHRIESWAQEHLDDVDDFEELGARLQKSIYCGELVMSALEDELSTITSNSTLPGRGIRLTWNNSVLSEHQHRIRGQVASLQLLLQVANLPRKEDRTEVLSVKEKVFLQSDESALSIIPSDRSTRFSLDGNRLSIISDDGNIQYIRFSFEDALFTSHVYKRNYRFPVHQARMKKHMLPEVREEEVGLANSSELEIKTLTDACDDEDEEQLLQDQLAEWHHDIFVGKFPESSVEDQLLQDQMAEWHDDLFVGNPPEINVDPPQSSMLKHGTSTTADSEARPAPLSVIVSSKNDTENDTKNYSTAPETPPDVPTLNTQRIRLQPRQLQDYVVGPIPSFSELAQRRRRVSSEITQPLLNTALRRVSRSPSPLDGHMRSYSTGVHEPNVPINDQRKARVDSVRPPVDNGPLIVNGSYPTPPRGETRP